MGEAANVSEEMDGKPVVASGLGPLAILSDEMYGKSDPDPRVAVQPLRSNLSEEMGDAT